MALFYNVKNKNYLRLNGFNVSVHQRLTFGTDSEVVEIDLPLRLKLHINSIV